MASPATAASVESSLLALVRASSDASPIFAHQIGEELSRASGGAKSGALDLRIASSGAPLYVWTFPPLLFNALVRLGSRGDISFLPVSGVEGKMSMLGVKGKHPPLIATGADLSKKTHMIPLRVVPGVVAKSGAFHFVGADESSTRFDWNTVAAAPTSAKAAKAAKSTTTAKTTTATKKAAAAKTRKGVKAKASGKGATKVRQTASASRKTTAAR